RVRELQVSLHLVHHRSFRHVVKPHVVAAPLALDSIGEFARAPLVGFDHLAAALGDETRKTPDGFLDLWFALIGPKNKDRFVAPQCANPPYGFKPQPGARSKEAA